MNMSYKCQKTWTALYSKIVCMAIRILKETIYLNKQGANTANSAANYFSVTKISRWKNTGWAFFFSVDQVFFCKCAWGAVGRCAGLFLLRWDGIWTMSGGRESSLCGLAPGLVPKFLLHISTVVLYCSNLFQDFCVTFVPKFLLHILTVFSSNLCHTLSKKSSRRCAHPVYSNWSKLWNTCQYTCPKIPPGREYIHLLSANLIYRSIHTVLKFDDARSLVLPILID